MDKQYIIVRVAKNGQAEIVHSANTIKDARYWLCYIALAGDALFQTAAHPKYDGTDGKPVYKAHLISRGNIGHNESEWKSFVLSSGAELQIPN